jgi:4-hydroxy-4-methyl-2-oxoglutarate aldolase
LGLYVSLRVYWLKWRIPLAVKKMAVNEENSRAKIGKHQPAQIGELPEVDVSVTARWQEIAGLSSTISDILDEFGYRLSVPVTFLPARSPGQCVVGRALTLRYLPERRTRELAKDGLIHQSAMQYASKGDVLVIEGDGVGLYSVFGGLAGHRAAERGIGGVIVDGAVRDLDQLASENIPVWSKGVTSVTGRGRLQGVAINVPVRIHDVQVVPGDIVIADESGVCFVPGELLTSVDARLQALVEEESRILGSK